MANSLTTIKAGALADDAITTAKIADDAITSAKIADDAVVTAAIADDAVVTASIADDAITSALIADDAVVTAAIADDAVTGANIADDTVAEANMANDAISIAEIKAGTQGDLLYYGSSGAPALLSAGTSGHFLKTQGSGANPTWAANAVSGNILQIQQYNNTGRTTTSSDTYGGMGLEDIITPNHADNKILILVSAPFAVDSNNASTTYVTAQFRLVFNHSGISETVIRRVTYMINFPEDSGMDMIMQDECSFAFVHHPNTTNAVTYELQGSVAQTSSTLEVIEGGSGDRDKTITLIEIEDPAAVNLTGG